MEKQLKLILIALMISIVLITIVFAFLNYLKNDTDKKCEEIGLVNNETGNCCFIKVDGEYNAYNCSEVFNDLKGGTEK